MKGDIEIGIRMAEEAEAKMHCDRRTVWNWRNGCVPSGMWLAKLHYCGGDVIYVLTGKRGMNNGRKSM